MKKVLSITLLTLFLLSATELYQLLKMPVLVQHYLEHSEENKDLSLWDFLANHYSTEKAEHDQDNQLPFKSHGDFSCLIHSITIAHNYPQLSKPIHSEEKLFPIYEEFFLSRAHSSSVWQPPKSC